MSDPIEAARPEAARPEGRVEASAPPTVLRWESLTKKQFDRIDPARAVVFLTCSPMEVHGPHLPLGADALEGHGLARRLLRFLPEPHRSRTFLQLPLVWTGSDIVPQRGSLEFRPSTTVRVLEDLGRTLAAQGFRDVLISNFHGGPRHFLAIERACERVNRRHGIRMVSVFSLMLSRLPANGELGSVFAGIPGVDPADFEGDTHAGLLETAQLLALHGDWIDPDYKSLPRITVRTWLERRGESSPEPRGRLQSVGAALRGFRDGIRFFSEESYSGAPAGASAELGEAFLDTLGREAAGPVAELLDGRIGPGDCHSPIWPLRFFFLNPLMIRLGNWWIAHRSPIS